MANRVISTDDAGCFFEDWSRNVCDFCGEAHDANESHDADEDGLMCHECFSILWGAASEAHTRMMRENGILFSVFSPDIHEMLEEHGHLLEGRKPLP